MKRVQRLGTGLAIAGFLALAKPSFAQHTVRQTAHSRTPNAAAASLPSSDLLSHFGVARAFAMASGNDLNENLRAILRAREVGTPDALSAIIPAKDPLSFARSDGRMMIALVRTLADVAETPEARATLGAMVSMPSVLARQNRGAATAEEMEQFDLARSMAAMALASTRDPEGARTLVVLLRSGGAPAAAAALALRAYPPIDRTWTTELPTERANLELARASSDLRDVNALEALATRGLPAATEGADAIDAPGTGARSKKGDAKGGAKNRPPPVELGSKERVLVLAALGRFGDAHVVTTALKLHGTTESAVRVASLEARIAVGAANVADDCAALIADDLTMEDGVRLAGTIPAPSPAVVKALAARLAVTSDDELRARILTTLARIPSTAALDAILPFVHDPRVAINAVNALARSPLPRAKEILETLAAVTATRRLALRGYLVRATTRGERSDAIDALVRTLMTAKDPLDRALARSLSVALHFADITPAKAADDPDARVVRAVLLAAPLDAALAQHALSHADPTTRALAMAQLAALDPARVAGNELANRVRNGDIDAPLAARALAARAHESDEATLALLTSSDDVLHVEALRGYGSSSAPDRAGRLLDRLLYAASAAERRVLLNILTTSFDERAWTPALRQTIQDAARLDPDAECRATARGLRFGAGADQSETVWLHVQTADALPPQSARPYSGLLITSDGPLPVVFDDDGDALILRVPSGPARLRLAPRVSSYEPATP